MGDDYGRRQPAHVQHHRGHHRHPDAEEPPEPAEIGARPRIHPAHPVDGDHPSGRGIRRKTPASSLAGQAPTACSVNVEPPSSRRIPPSSFDRDRVANSSVARSLKPGRIDRDHKLLPEPAARHDVLLGVDHARAAWTGTVERGPRADRRSVRTGGPPERAGAFTGSADAREAAGRELLRAEAGCAGARQDPPRGLSLRAQGGSVRARALQPPLELAREAGDERLGELGRVLDRDRPPGRPRRERAVAAPLRPPTTGPERTATHCCSRMRSGISASGGTNRAAAARAGARSKSPSGEDGFLPGVAAGLTLGRSPTKKGAPTTRAGCSKRRRR